MNKYKKGDIVKYVGENNFWTFKEDILTNSRCEIINHISKVYLVVKFENNVTASFEMSDIDYI